MSPTETGVDRQTGTVAADLAEAPSREGRDKEEQRRHLRLVQIQARRRAGRRRLLVVLGISIVAVVCLALVALHVLIAENQFKLDGLQQQAATAQASYEKLRLQVSQLEAPARIVSEAEGQLGMVQPATVTYLPAISSTRPATARKAPKGSVGGQAGKGGASSNGTASDGPGGDRAASNRGTGQKGGSYPASADPPPTNIVTAPPGNSDWPSIKPYLSGSP